MVERDEQRGGGGPTQSLEEWLGLVARVVCFLLGAAILIWQTVATKDDSFRLEIIAVACMAPLVGPLLVAGLVQLLLALRGERIGRQ